ncbi:MAG: RNA 2',3'-cyclic phosphodiesterase [archaeon]
MIKNHMFLVASNPHSDLTQRVFVSLDIPEKLKKEVRKIQDKLPDYHGKKTELENLHLTLKFLGEVKENKIEEIKNRLRKIKFKRFRIELKYLGYFDNQKYGVVWIYLSNCEELQRQVDKVLSGLFEKEERFMSHLTIARVKKLDNKKEFLKKLKQTKIFRLEFIADSFELKESVLTNKGSFHKTLEKYDLE